MRWAEDNEVHRPGKEICLEADHSIYHNLTPRIGRLERVEKVKASTDMTVAKGKKIKRIGQWGGLCENEKSTKQNDGFANNSKSSNETLPLSPFSLVSFGHVFLFSLPRGWKWNSYKFALPGGRKRYPPTLVRYHTNRIPITGPLSEPVQLFSPGGCQPQQVHAELGFRTARFLAVPRTKRVDK